MTTQPQPPQSWTAGLAADWRTIRDFIDDEVQGRMEAGGEETDYLKDAKDAAAACERLVTASDLAAAAQTAEAALLALDAMWTEDVPIGPGEEGDIRLFAPETLRVWRQQRAALAQLRAALRRAGGGA